MLFFAGLFSGIAIIALYSFVNAPSSPQAGSKVTPITAAAAHQYVAKYLTDAAPLNQVIKGFTIDKTQLEAMNAILKENAELAGFRIYMGKDESSKKFGIVVGISSTGADAVKNTIFNTDSQLLSPCPPVCDVTSPIILDK